MMFRTDVDTNDYLPSIIGKDKKTMDEKKIERINELYHKSKGEGLSEEEKKEQQALRQEYLASIRNNIRSQLDHVTVVNPDGTKVDLKKARDYRMKKEWP